METTPDDPLVETPGKESESPESRDVAQGNDAHAGAKSAASQADTSINQPAASSTSAKQMAQLAQPSQGPATQIVQRQPAASLTQANQQAQGAAKAFPQAGILGSQPNPRVALKQDVDTRRRRQERLALWNYYTGRTLAILSTVSAMVAAILAAGSIGPGWVLALLAGASTAERIAAANLDFAGLASYHWEHGRRLGAICEKLRLESYTDEAAIKEFIDVEAHMQKLWDRILGRPAGDPNEKVKQ